VKNTNKGKKARNRAAMKKMMAITLSTISLLNICCVKKYKRTVKHADCQLYIEVFNVNPAGVDEDYLTDSSNFRVYVGQFDNEHENFGYVCNGDSIKIIKSRIDGTYNETIDSITLSRSDLVAKKMSNTKPLFEFK
jgi:hypothetical protein